VPCRDLSAVKFIPALAILYRNQLFKGRWSKTLTINNKMNKYSVVKGLIKSIKYVVLFLIAGLLVGLKPEIKELTIGGVLILVYNWLKVQWGVKLP